jgi:hypothetical protein
MESQMCGLFVWFAGLGNPSLHGQFVPFIERAIKLSSSHPVLLLLI